MHGWVGEALTYSRKTYARKSIPATAMSQAAPA
jgi:hypothetical protein